MTWVILALCFAVAVLTISLCQLWAIVDEQRERLLALEDSNDEMFEVLRDAFDDPGGPGDGQEVPRPAPLTLAKSA